MVTMLGRPETEAVKRRLREPRRAALALQEKRGRIAALESLAEGIGGVLRREKGQTGGDAVLEMLVELRSALLEAVMRYGALVREVQELFERCLPDERHRAVMEAHYLGFTTWEAVAEQVGYTPRHVMRLHKESLQLIIEQTYDINPTSHREAAI